MIGFLASSKAGHDKDKIYVIVKENTEYVWLADGKIKTMEKPKKKRKKHIQLIKCCINAEIENALSEGKNVSDLEIMMFLKAYKKQQMSDTGGN